MDPEEVVRRILEEGLVDFAELDHRVFPMGTPPSSTGGNGADAGRRGRPSLHSIHVAVGVLALRALVGTQARNWRALLRGGTRQRSHMASGDERRYDPTDKAREQAYTLKEFQDVFSKKGYDEEWILDRWARSPSAYEPPLVTIQAKAKSPAGPEIEAKEESSASEEEAAATASAKRLKRQKEKKRMPMMVPIVMRNAHPSDPKFSRAIKSAF